MSKFDYLKEKISVIGLGYVGLPLSLLLARKFMVIGFDNDASKISKLIDGEKVISEPGVEELLLDNTVRNKLSFTNNVGDILNTRVKIITVGTPYDINLDYIDYSQLNGAIDLLDGNIKSGDIVVLKSTVPPGTTNQILKRRLEFFGFNVPNDVGIAFSPERMVEGQAIRDFSSLPKIIGASDPQTSAIVSEIVGSMGGEVIQVSSPETAEMIKMVDNYSRFTFLGLTNEIALISEKIGIDVLELIMAAKQGYPRNAGLMTPGPGVGGSCLNKDPFILSSHLKKLNLELQMVGAASIVNRSIPNHIAEIVNNFANGRKIVTIAGVAFKGDTDDTRFTPTFEIKSKLENLGFKIILSDPYVSQTPLNIIKDPYEASRSSDIFLLLTDHSDYKEIELRLLRSMMAEKPLIVDTRGLISKEMAMKLGFEYHGYGRL